MVAFEKTDGPDLGWYIHWHTPLQRAHSLQIHGNPKFSKRCLATRGFSASSARANQGKEEIGGKPRANF
jgi:hypothetical protein